MWIETSGEEQDRSNTEALIRQVEDSRSMSTSQQEIVIGNDNLKRSDDRNLATYFDVLNLGEFEVLESPERLAEAERQLARIYANLRNQYNRTLENHNQTVLEAAELQNITDHGEELSQELQNKKLRLDREIDDLKEQLDAIEMQLKEVVKIANNNGIKDYLFESEGRSRQ